MNVTRSKTIRLQKTKKPHVYTTDEGYQATRVGYGRPVYVFRPSGHMIAEVKTLAKAEKVIAKDLRS